MKSKKEIIEFIQSELMCNNTLVIATLGNGGAGLTYIQTQDEEEIATFVNELESAAFQGSVEGCEDILECELYSDECQVYQFDGDNGSYTQIMA